MNIFILGIYQGIGVLIMLGIAYRIWYPIKIQHTNINTTMTKEEYIEMMKEIKK